MSQVRVLHRPLKPSYFDIPLHGLMSAGSFSTQAGERSNVGLMRLSQAIT
jgi:hypothetical protein